MTTWTETAPSGVSRKSRRIPIGALGMSLGLFLLISYLLCVLIGIVAPGWGLHLRPWIEMLPGFIWLSWPSFLLGAVETLVLGWYAALVFAPLYNFFAARGGR